MSTILVDNLTGKTSAGSITVTSEGGAATQSLQQGLAKAWGNMNGSGTPAFRDSINHGSITDHGTGQFTVAFTSNMNNDDYSCPSTGSRSDTVGAVAMSITPRLLTTSNYRFTCEYANSTTWDYENIFLSTLGDLA